MLEKILEELTEVQFGYLRVNVAMKPISLRNGKLNIDEKVKFYFWVNISGVCTIADPQTNQISPIFNQYKYVKVTPKQTNGYKLMTDKDEMMKLILPSIS